MKNALIYIININYRINSHVIHVLCITRVRRFPESTRKMKQNNNDEKH